MSRGPCFGSLEAPSLSLGQWEFESPRRGSRASTGSNPVATVLILPDVTAAWPTVNRPVLVRVRREERPLEQVTVGPSCNGQHLSLSERRSGFDSRPPRHHVLVVQRTERDPAKVEAAGSNPAEGNVSDTEHGSEVGRVNPRGGEFAWKAKRRASAGVRVVRPPLPPSGEDTGEGKRVRVTRLAR